MTDNVHSTDLTGALEFARGVARRDTNNLALADQIQFSSILRMLVDAPEKTLEIAQAATKSSEPDERRSEVSERKDRPSRRTERREDRGPDDDLPRRVHEPRAERNDPVAIRPITKAEPNTDEPSTDNVPAPTDTNAERLVPNPPQAQRIGLETLRAPEAVAALVASRTSELAPSELPEGPSARAQAMLVRAAQSMASSALSDHQFSRVGEDLHDAVLHKLANVSTRTGAPTAASSLKEQQEADLASRLGLAGSFAVQVDLGNEAARMRSNPLHTLTAGATMAELDGLNADAQPFTPSFSKGNGDGLGADQKTPATHGNLLPDRPSSTPDWANTFNQALRTQGAMVAAQAGTDPKAQPLPSELSQANGVGAPTGPSQVSQLAKANPASAARQPERPQPPAEQIAVKIRQAIGEGADKINIKLHPANLGRVEVRLDIKDGHISAVVLAERKETLELLQRDARGLERALLDAGLRTDIQSLSFGLRGDGQRQVDMNRERRGNATGRSSDQIEHDVDRDEGIAGKTSGYGRNLRLNGGVDIRV